MRFEVLPEDENVSRETEKREKMWKALDRLKATEEFPVISERYQIRD